MVITSILFFIFYSKIDFVQRRNDRNRISNIKTALELEDIDFINMVNDLNLDYDENDLKQIEKEISHSIGKITELSGGPSTI